MSAFTRRLALLCSFCLVTVLTVAAPAADAQVVGGLGNAEELRLDSPLTGTAAISPTTGRSGPIELSIRLVEPAAAAGGDRATIAAQQATLIGAINAAGGTVEGSVDTVLNAVFATMDVSAMADMADLDIVRSIREVAHYDLMLDETVPYIGATAVQATGTTGEGVTVAVLDSGVDYTHADLGGPGTIEAYEAAHGVGCSFSETWTCEQENFATTDGLFPTERVVGGFDFVGEVWPFGERTEDPDPIDFEGHGTHVADIIGGTKGVAPGVDLLAIKVCSAVAGSCNGIALIRGVEWAVENGADIMNMSLGALYGSAFDDDLSAATDNATLAGVLTVAAAGNSADKPYVTGTPSATPTALSVAQTQVPSASLPFLQAVDPAGEVAARISGVFQPWALEPVGVVEGALQYGDGAGGNLLGCDAFAPGSLDGLVVLVDRGVCAFTQKIANIANGGGAVGIIGLVAPGAPFGGGFTGGEACDPDLDGQPDCDDIPAYMISQADSSALKGVAGTGFTIRIDPADALPLVGSMVGSSSRGPGLNFNNLLKPEIGAPGASVSAAAGTGTGTTPFGGTSGAAPMVAGAAALQLAASPELAPLQVKAKLVNTAETSIITEPGAGLAPITRIGGGEVRADRAIAASASAWDSATVSPTLSFGFAEVSDAWTATKSITVENYGDSPLTYSITPTFRYDNDAANGAVTPSVSTGTVSVPADGSATFELTLNIDGAKLRPWTGNSGSAGADPSWLDLLEYDGYLVLDAPGDADDLHLPWHVLPRKAAEVTVERNKKVATLTNSGVSDASIEAYNLIAVSEDIPEGPRGGAAPTPDIRAAGIALTEVPETFCSSGLLMAFAVNTWEPQTHANAPVLMAFELDFDGDGEADYVIYNVDLSVLTQGALTLGDGRNAVYVQDLSTNEFSVFFFVDHETNSTNTVLRACGEQFGLDTKSIKGKQVGVALATDFYYGGPSDVVPFELGAGKLQDPIRVGNQPTQLVELPSGQSVDVRLFATNSKSLGAMLMVRGGATEEVIILEK